MLHTLQDDDIRNHIRSLMLNGETIKSICDTIGITENTWYVNFYRNTEQFRDFINGVKKELFLREAEKVSIEVMSADHTDDVRVLAIKQKEAEFLRETLGKDNYSKKTEIDNTTPITINVKSYNDTLAQPVQPVSITDGSVNSAVAEKTVDALDKVV
jgi:hypothetical protein